jgi:mannobiose 2-epimerase
MNSIISLAGFACLLLSQVALAADPPAEPTSATYRALADQTEASLKNDVLAKWFPVAIDQEHGGFHENFKEDWSRGGGNQRSIVYQSRLTWLAAQAANRYPEEAARFNAIAQHGLQFIETKMWDPAHGGVFWAVDDAGHPAKERGEEKHAYGISFAIYAAAAEYQATHDARALDFATKTFQWLDAHAHDAEHGGYYEALSAEGNPILKSPAGGSDAIGTRYGYKSMNTHIHLLEAFTALHEINHDELIHSRLRDTFEIVRDKIYTGPGCLHLYFNPDWRPIPELDSFGHDLETAFLLVEAATTLGQPDDLTTWTRARRLVDHALEFGWDNERGGFYNEATTFGRDVTKEKIWWVQAEGLNSLLLMHERFGRGTPRYWQAFEKQWSFIRQYQIDAKHGGWYATVNAEGAPTANRAKSDRWTEGYHQGRALLNVTAKLRQLAEKSS